MFLLSLTSFFLLGGYLLLTAMRFGIPDMVSDTYYQLGKKGWVFSAVLSACALLMMVAILDADKGVQCLAFMGTAGLVFVAFAPDYLDQDEYKVHKGGATVAALGCVAWCLSVNIWPTVAIGGLYALYLAAREVGKASEMVWWLASVGKGWHPWYWAEVACFADVFVTYALALP